MGILDNFTPEQIKQIKDELSARESQDKEFVLRDIDEEYRKGKFKKIGIYKNGSCSYELWKIVVQAADYITENFSDKERGKVYRCRDIKVPVPEYKDVVRALCESVVDIWEKHKRKE